MADAIDDTKADDGVAAKVEGKTYTEEEVKARVERAVKARLKNKPDLSADDLDAFQEWKSNQAKQAEDEAAKKGQWDTLKAKLTDTHNKQTTKLTSIIERRVADSELINAAAAAGARNPQRIAKVLREFVRVEIGDDDATAIVLDSKGQPRTNDKGDPYTIADLIAEDKASDPGSYNAAATVSKGSGTRPAGGGVQTTQPKRGFAAFAAKHYTN